MNPERRFLQVTPNTLVELNGDLQREMDRIVSQHRRHFYWQAAAAILLAVLAGVACSVVLLFLLR